MKSNKPLPSVRNDDSFAQTSMERNLHKHSSGRSWNSEDTNSSNHSRNTSHDRPARQAIRQKNQRGFYFITALVVIVLIITIILIFKNNQPARSLSSSDTELRSSFMSMSSSTISKAQGFWGDKIDFSKEILPVKGDKKLEKWPSVNGFDVESADLSSYVAKPYQNGVLEGVTVILDPGHGGEDLGAVYPRSPKPVEIAESKVNMQVALLLKARLEQLGVKVVLTRSDNTFKKLYYRSAVAAKTVLSDISGQLAKDSKNKTVFNTYLEKIEQTILANSDDDKEGWFYGLGVRREVKNIMDLQSACTNYLFLSLHCNSSDKADTLFGTKVYYSSNKAIYDDESAIEKDRIYPEYQNYDDENRKYFATLLYNNIILDNASMKQKANTSGIGATNYAVIREQNLVSALVEMGYVNHTANRAFLLDTAKQKELCESMARAIYEYYCKTK